MPRAVTDDSSVRGRTVLLVDDSAPLLVALERQFRVNGVHCLTAVTGEAALKMLDGHVVHAVVADERLPDYSGLVLLEEIGQSFRVGRVLLTAYLEPYLEAEAVARGITALDKSVPFEALLQVVKRELWRKHG